MTYQICTRCVMDTTDPEIEFDADGRCSHCRRAEQMLATGWFPDASGRAMLDALAAKIREYGAGREYDCIIGVSGGVDSSYVLTVAKNLMGLRPLAVHVDAGWNSEIAVANIERLVKALDIDLFTYVVDWEEIKDLQLAFLNASVPNQDVPQDHVFFAKLYEFAIANDIRYVLTGSNLATESILPQAWGYDATDKRHIVSIHKRFGKKKLRTFPMMNLFEYRVYWPYIRRMKRFAPLNYLDYNKANAIREMEERYGWRYYGGKHYESRWTRFFQSYYLPHKFGYDKRRAHLSSMIVAGQMTREAALAELAQPPYDPHEVATEKEYVARKLGITTAELERLIALPNRTHRDYPNNERIFNLITAARVALKSRDSRRSTAIAGRARA